jgi:hypothetical protein
MPQRVPQPIITTKGQTKLLLHIDVLGIHPGTENDEKSQFVASRERDLAHPTDCYNERLCQG